MYLFLMSMGHSGFEKKTDNEPKKKRKWIIILGTIGGILVAYWAIQIGINRMNHYGMYSLSYSNGIGYTGPGGEIAAWLYGYFVLTFNNLNRSIIMGRAIHNYLGLYSFPDLFFGILQFDNLLGLANNQAQSASAWVVRATTVPTGFWSFYYDYGVICFIPILVAFIRERLIMQYIRIAKRKIIWVVLFFYYVPQWLFMNFTNTVFDVTGLTTGLITYFLLSRFIYENRD